MCRFFQNTVMIFDSFVPRSHASSCLVGSLNRILSKKSFLRLIAKVCLSICLTPYLKTVRSPTNFFPNQCETRAKPLICIHSKFASYLLRNKTTHEVAELDGERELQPCTTERSDEESYKGKNLSSVLQLNSLARCTDFIFVFITVIYDKRFYMHYVEKVGNCDLEGALAFKPFDECN